jgi:hypothetical protein
LRCHTTQDMLYEIIRGEILTPEKEERMMGDR